MLGRPRKPTAAKVREGTVRPSRAPKREASPAVGVPDCPAGVRGDKDARYLWDSLVGQLETLRLLTLIDGAALEGLCRAYSVAVRADRQLKKGVTHKTAWGVQVHPAVSVSRLAWAEVRKFCSEFGLTPASRTRINTEKPDEAQDRAGDFLFGATGKVAGAIRPA